MRGRGFYIALGIFAVAVLAYYLLEVQKAGTPSSQSTPSAQASPLTNLRQSEVERLVIKSTATAKQVILAQASGNWTYAVCAADQADCPGQPADKLRAALLAEEIVHLRPDRVIYGAPAGLPAYGLDTATTGEIDLTAKGTKHILLLGSKTADGLSYWLRLDDRPDVVVVSSSLVDGTFLAAITTPPAPVPSPSPSAAATSPSPSPAVSASP